MIDENEKQPYVPLHPTFGQRIIGSIVKTVTITYILVLMGAGLIVGLNSELVSPETMNFLRYLLFYMFFVPGILLAAVPPIFYAVKRRRCTLSTTAYITECRSGLANITDKKRLLREVQLLF